jgi:hypothetical protein
MEDGVQGSQNTSPSGCLTPFPRGRIRPVVGPSLFMLNMECKMSQHKLIVIYGHLHNRHIFYQSR